MNSNITTDLLESFEEERLNFKNLVRRFENFTPQKLSKSPSLNLLVFPSNLPDNKQFNVDQVNCGTSQNEAIESGKHGEMCSKEKHFVAEKPPVPPRTGNMKLPTALMKEKCTPATVRRSIRMRNWNTTNYVSSTLSHKSNILKQNVEDRKINNVLPVPAPRNINGLYGPINRSNSCMTLTNQDGSTIKDTSIKKDAKIIFDDLIAEDDGVNFTAISKASCGISKNTLSRNRKSKNGTRPYKSSRVKDFDLPPLPPRPVSKKHPVPTSKYLAPPNQSFTYSIDKGSTNNDAVNKLIESIFCATSACTSNNNKSILLHLIDIMTDIIQGYSNEENMEDESAWYSNMRDFVQSETKTYLEVNQLSKNNCNVAYDELLSAIVPKFIQSYGNVDYSNSGLKNQTDNEETYEIIWEKDKKPSNTEMVLGGEIEKIFSILDEMKRSENRFIKNLKENVYAYKNEVGNLALGETLLARVYPVLENLLRMQYKFRDVLEAKSHDLFWFLETFLEFEELFDLYIKFFGNKVTIFSDGSIPSNKEKVQSSENLSALLTGLPVILFLYKILATK